MSFSFKELLAMKKAGMKKKSNKGNVSSSNSSSSAAPSSSCSSSLSGMLHGSVHHEDLGLLEGATLYDKLKKLEYMRNNFAIPEPLPSGAMQLLPSVTQSTADTTIDTTLLATRAPPKQHIITIAICLVIVDKLHNEEIWREWIESGERDPNSPYRAQLYIHAKFPDRVRTEWARQRTLKHSFLPEWNSPEVIRAMLATLTEALRDESCAKFVFGTESCMPIYPLAKAAQLLLSDSKSWLNAFHRAKNPFEEATCFRAVKDSMIPATAVWKAIPGWIMLTRRHAKLVTELPALARADLVSAWGKGQWYEGCGGVWAPEEVYFPTMLALLGFLRDGGDMVGTPGEDHVKRQSVTFAEFAKKGDANPIDYKKLTPTLLHKFRKSGAVFARKFGGGVCSLREWMLLVGETDKSSGAGAGSGSCVGAGAGAGTVTGASASTGTGAGAGAGTGTGASAGAGAGAGTGAGAGPGAISSPSDCTTLRDDKGASVVGNGAATTETPATAPAAKRARHV